MPCARDRISGSIRPGGEESGRGWSTLLRFTGEAKRAQHAQNPRTKSTRSLCVEAEEAPGDRQAPP